VSAFAAAGDDLGAEVAKTAEKLAAGHREI
jgi:hypothetical protein